MAWFRCVIDQARRWRWLTAATPNLPDQPNALTFRFQRQKGAACCGAAEVSLGASLPVLATWVWLRPFTATFQKPDRLGPRLAANPGGLCPGTYAASSLFRLEHPLKRTSETGRIITWPSSVGWVWRTGGRTMQAIARFEMLLRAAILRTERDGLHLHLLCCLLETSSSTRGTNSCLKLGMLIALHRNIIIAILPTTHSFVKLGRVL